MARTLGVNVFSAAFVAGYSEAANSEPFLKHLPPLDLSELTYATVIQAGVDSIRLSSLETGLSQSPLLRGRLQLRTSPFWGLCYGLLHELVSSRLARGWANDSQHQHTVRTIAYVSDLLAGVHDGTDIGWFTSPPDPARIREALPVDLGVPMYNLLIALSPISTTVATPARTIDHSMIASFEEILAGQLFREYQVMHAALGDSRIDLQESARAVADTAGQLCRSSHTLLRTRAICGIALPVGAAMAKQLIKWLPSPILDALAASLQMRIEVRHRLVIYHFNEVLGTLMDWRMMDFMRRLAVAPPVSEE